MWDDQVAALEERVPHPALRPARPRRHRRARRQVLVRHAHRRRDRADGRARRSSARISAGISMGGMTALFLAQRHGDRFDRIIACDCGPASTPQSAQQWKERIDLGAEKGMEALVDVDHQPLVPARLRGHQGAGARQDPRHDPHHAVSRASPAAPRRCRTSTPAGPCRHQEPDAVHLSAPRTRRYPGMRGDQRRRCRAPSWSKLEGAGHIVERRAARRNSPRRSGISSKALNRAHG